MPKDLTLDAIPLLNQDFSTTVEMTQSPVIPSIVDAYREVGSRATHDCMDAGGRTTQDAYRDIGGRVMQEQLPR